MDVEQLLKGGRIRELVRELLVEIGEDPDRAGLVKTPERFERSIRYLTSGYHQDVEQVISGAKFVERYDEMVLVRGIDVFSMCEHHMLPFFGKCHVAYVPDGQILGLSKIPKVVEIWSRRLQVQERMTNQIAESLWEKLRPLGVGVVVEAKHLCLMMRGVQKLNATMVTSAMKGCFRSDPKTRSEFLALLKQKEE